MDKISMQILWSVLYAILGALVFILGLNFLKLIPEQFQDIYKIGLPIVFLILYFLSRSYFPNQKTVMWAFFLVSPQSKRLTVSFRLKSDVGRQCSIEKKGKSSMVQLGTWTPFEGSGALLLALALFIIGCVLTYLGLRLHSPVGVAQPGKIVSALLVTMWCLSIITFLNSIITYMQSLIQQVGPFTPPSSPISPITNLSALVTFIIIAYLSRHHGLKVALGSAIVGTISAPMIFELPYDLVVMWRLYPPISTQLTLLFFLPLFLIEISSFLLLTLSPLTKISKYTLFTLAAMFFVFSIWALFGFSYPSSPIPFALNAASKVLCFMTAITFFLPQTGIKTKENQK